MRAVLQNFGTGKLSVAEVPPPALNAGGVLVHNVTSLVSAGTERAMIELAKKNPLGKAKARPDLVKKVLSRAGQEGILGTAQIVWNLVNRPIPLGYSCAGLVHAVGADVADYQVGDRVACAGLGHANHAEVIFSPHNLTVRIPEGIDFDEAAFVTVGAIAMQSVRQAELGVGETVVVLGLGLVGQLVSQICLAAGCRVFGIDLDPNKIKLACDLGAQGGASTENKSLRDDVKRFTKNRGADVIILAAATSSNEPVVLAAELARDRAKVIALGEVGLNIPRRAYYEKELDLRLSRSYGPGRYDRDYEEHGKDYPVGYVRWTENRNMESFLELVAEGKVKIKPLITHRYSIEGAAKAYELLSGKQSGPYLGILLDYDPGRAQPSSVSLGVKDTPARVRIAQIRGEIHFGIIGAGQFAQGILLPKLRHIKFAEIDAIATGSGHTARAVAEKYRARFCTSDYTEILKDEKIHAVLIATRHYQHAEMVSEALAAGKHVFVEKPLAISKEQLNKVIQAYRNSNQDRDGRVLMVGYNRRFSPLATELRHAIDGKILVMNYRVNAGPVPPDHWTQDPDVGGGRIVGEVCHFIDFLQYLSGSIPTEVFAWSLGDGTHHQADPDNVSIQIRFANGSVGTVIYTAVGDVSLSKERIEIFGGGTSAVIENWRRLDIYQEGKRSRGRALITADKGHAKELEAFVRGIKEGVDPIPFESLVLTTRATFAIQESLRQGQPVPLEQDPEGGP